MKNIGQMMKQAQQLQTKMGEMQEKLNAMEILGASGGGMVSVVVNGKGEMRTIKLDKVLVDPEEIEVLEDLIVAAFNDAKTRMGKKVSEEMSKITGGLDLPGGMKLPF